MRKTIYVLLAAAALSGVTSCTSKTEEHSTETNTTTTDPAAMDSSMNITDTTAATGAAGSEAGPVMLDADFAKMAASGGILEVELGKVAAKNAADANVKSFGTMMSTDHSGANAKLKKIADDKKMELPTAMNPEHQATYDRLSKLKGAEFDKAYMGDMVKDHEKDITLFKTQSEKGTDAELKAFAQSTLPTLQAHLDKANSIAASVGATAAEPTAGEKGAAAHASGEHSGH
jgi:putative membrane protein